MAIIDSILAHIARNEEAVVVVKFSGRHGKVNQVAITMDKILPQVCKRLETEGEAAEMESSVLRVRRDTGDIVVKHGGKAAAQPEDTPGAGRTEIIKIGFVIRKETPIHREREDMEELLVSRSLSS